MNTINGKTDYFPSQSYTKNPVRIIEKCSELRI
jgi:hypothetical protein